MPSPSPTAVHILQPVIEHYRLPVFDAVLERAGGDYTLAVHGRLIDGEAKGGGTRPYLRHHPYEERRVAGLRFFHWPGIDAELEMARPAVVIANTHLRLLNCWRLPATCARLGAVPVTWGKVHSFSGLPPALLRLGKRRLYRPFARHIVYGEASRRELLEVGIPDETIFIAQNTIDTRSIFDDAESFRRRAAELRRVNAFDDAKILLSVARFDPEKRLGDLVDAWPRLRELDPALRLVLVGGGPLLDEIRARAAAVDSERILVTGRVPVGDDYGWIAAADMTFQCGAVGLAINQSLAFGKPTIIADEYGSDTELVEHGRTGWRYPRGDLDALTGTVREIIAEPKRARAIAAAGRALVHDHANIDRMADAFDACIRAALRLREMRPAR
jgi:glycosyltransferase involved in cell wall biosynthesis